MANRLVRTRGNALATVSDTFYLSGFAKGDSKMFAIDHEDNNIDEDDDVYARFANNPMPSVEPVPGFEIEVLVEGTNGNEFRLRITFLGADAGDDYVAYVNSDDAYIEYVGGYIDDPGSPQGVLSWSRTGFLADSAFD